MKTLTFALPLIISSKMIVFCKLRIWFLQKFNNFTHKKLDFFREIVCFICILLFANNFVCWKMQTIFVCEEFAKYSSDIPLFAKFGGSLIGTNRNLVSCCPWIKYSYYLSIFTSKNLVLVPSSITMTLELIIGTYSVHLIPWPLQKALEI